MPQQQSKSARWYPTEQQLKDPSSLERAFRQLLTQHYALHDKFTAMQGAQGDKTTSQPTGSGPVDTMLLGLHVAPIDTATLVDGAKLTYVKASGNLEFL